jgi:ABC-type phosphate transport system substrate-binding protein
MAEKTVVNPDVQQHSVTQQQLRAIVGMRVRNWSDGSLIHVFVLPDRNPIHIVYSKQVLGMFPHQLRKAWDRQVYSGTGQAPTKVNSVEEMLRKIAETPGAIGYLPEEKIDDSVRPIIVE